MRSELLDSLGLKTDVVLYTGAVVHELYTGHCTVLSIKPMHGSLSIITTILIGIKETLLVLFIHL